MVNLVTVRVATVVVELDGAGVSFVFFVLVFLVFVTALGRGVCGGAGCIGGGGSGGGGGGGLW